MSLKKTIYQFLYHSGRMIGWKWLILSAGVLLVSVIQSCKGGKVTCYQQQPTDTLETNDSIKYMQIDCYEIPSPPEALRMNKSLLENKDDSIDKPFIQ